MKSSRKSAVLLESIVTGFKVGGGGICIVNHSVTTSVARTGVVLKSAAAITTDTTLRRSQLENASIQPSCSRCLRIIFASELHGSTIIRGDPPLPPGQIRSTDDWRWFLDPCW